MMTNELEIAFKTLFRNADLSQEMKREVDKLSQLHPSFERHASLEEKEAYARQWLKVIYLGVTSGVMDETQRFYHVASAVEMFIHSPRHDHGIYIDNFKEVREEINAIRKAHGLEEDEDWGIGEGPPEWDQTNERFNEIDHLLMAQALRDVHEIAMAELLENYPTEYNRRREAGRRLIFGKVSEAYSLLMLMEHYRKESEACRNAGAYYAACTMIGSALEATLLSLCFHREQEMLNAIMTLPHKDQKHLLSPKRPKENWSLGDLIVVARQAGWLPVFKVNGRLFPVEEFIELISDIRNMVHPGKNLRERSGRLLGQRHFYDAEAVYILIASYLEPIFADIRAEHEKANQLLLFGEEQQN